MSAAGRFGFDEYPLRANKSVFGKECAPARSDTFRAKGKRLETCIGLKLIPFVYTAFLRSEAASSHGSSDSVHLNSTRAIRYEYDLVPLALG